MNQIKRCKPLLGTFVEINLQANLPEEALVDYTNQAFNEITRIEKALNFHQQNSELSQLNMALALAPNVAHTISDDLVTVLTLANDLFTHSNGIYDVSIASTLMTDKHLPNHLELTKQQLLSYGNFSNVILKENRIIGTKPLCFDLGGIAKGYAVDQAIAKIPNYISGYINAGGDMRATDWQKRKVSIKYGKRPSALKEIPLFNKALATSGSYYEQQGSTYFNPITHKYQYIKGCISVFSNSAMQADALTKIVTLMDGQKVKKLLKHYSAKAICTNRFGFCHQIN